MKHKYKGLGEFLLVLSTSSEKSFLFGKTFSTGYEYLNIA